MILENHLNDCQVIYHDSHSIFYTWYSQILYLHWLIKIRELYIKYGLAYN